MPRYKYFSMAEFACRCGCNKNEMSPTFLYRLDELRHRCGFPFVVVSGYRCKNHPIEAAKAGGPGQHSKGVAADIRVRSGAERYKLMRHAFDMNFGGIGPHANYVHVDDRAKKTAWVY